MTDSDIFAHAQRLISWQILHRNASDHERAMRLLKVTEEAGEVAQAYIGMTGQNLRKGVTHDADDVAAELCDVIVSAAVALHDFTSYPEAFMQRHIATRSARLDKLRKE